MSSEVIDLVLMEATDSMKKAIQRLELELTKVRAGRANPQMLDGLMVDYYGSQTPVQNVANINTPDARTLTIQPWEKGMIQAIEKAIMAANLGMNPQNDGVLIRINLPQLTEERRKELAKKAKSIAEDCKVSIRTARKEANDSLKQFQKNGLPEDLAKQGETKVQELTDKNIAAADKIYDAKEKEIMAV
jgi:ribosome recycling factor